MRRGVSLVEVVLVLALAGVLAALAVPRLAGWHDRMAVARAGAEVATFYRAARFAAVARSARVRVELSADTLRATYEGAGDSVARVRPGPGRHGVELRATQRVLRLGPTGLGWAAANTTIVLTRGAAAETLTVSRLGRLRVGSPSAVR